jgi:small subunit ribosomal protein S8
MSKDTIANLLTIIRNGVMRSKPSVFAAHSKMNVNLLEILKNEGFIVDFAVEQGQDGFNHIKIFLKYVQGESVIHDITRVSKPSRRVYRGLNNVKPVIGGLGISILSTNQGLITDKQAKALRVGGEVLCTVW